MRLNRLPLLVDPNNTTGGVLTLKAWAKIVWDYLRTPSISPMAITTTNKSVMGFNLSFLFKETELLDEAMAQLVVCMSMSESVTFFRCLAHTNTTQHYCSTEVG